MCLTNFINLILLKLDIKKQDIGTCFLFLVLFLCCPIIKLNADTLEENSTIEKNVNFLRIPLNNHKDLVKNISDLRNKNVLFISSYDPTFPTFFSQLSGVRHEFEKYDINIDIMCINRKRDLSKKGMSVFANNLKYRMSLKPSIDGIIVADDDAFRYAISERDKLLKDIPIVFLGVNDKELAYKQDAYSNITGVVEAVSINKTFNLIAELFPKTRRVIAISDATKPGIADLHKFYDVANKRNDREYSSLNLSKLSFNELKDQLSKLDDNDVLLLLSAFIDKTGSVISFNDIVNMLNEFSPVPVFHLWEHGIGKGLIGGYVISQYQQGSTAAQLLISMLLRKEITPLVVRNSTNLIMLDNNILEKYNVKLGNISKASNLILLNKKENLLQKYRYTLIIVCIILILLILVITILLSNAKKNKIVNDLLRKEKKKAEDESAAKLSFLANMSHEIRTPLNAVIGFSNLLVDEDFSREERKKYIDIIKFNNTLLLKLINDILDISKLDSRFSILEYQNIDLMQILKNTLISLQGIASQKNNEIRIVSDIKSMEIEYDPDRLKQVLNNLLTNAMKFTKGGLIEIIVKDLGDFVKISIKDNGIGIAYDKQKNVFTRFAKLNTYTQGTGLGLSLCKSIIESSNGKIYFTSVPNQGSCFSIEIPKRR